MGVVVVSSTAGTLTWVWWRIDRSLPDVSEVFTFVRDGTLTITTKDGTILQQIGPATRDKLKMQDIPPPLVEAFIASEDSRFYQHRGLDYQGVLRATVANILAREVVEGGSTITQQLARMVFLTQEQTAGRKIREAFLARKIEKNMRKQQILERYLNYVYLGSGAYGIADAAWVYFSKSVNELTLSEMAMIAGLPPAPSAYSPLVNLENARVRRNIVLQRMTELGYITAEAAAEAREQPLQVQASAPKRLKVEAPYFTSYIQKELPKLVSKEALEMGGLTVETTIDLKWQKMAEQVVKEAAELDGPAQGFEQAALVAIAPDTGEIKVMVGGRSFEESEFNRVTQAQRQPGSTFKGFVYAAAIAAGWSPYDGYEDANFKVDGYKPRNFGGKYRGWVSISDALTNSINVVAVKVLIDIGFEPTIELAKNMGIKSKLDPIYSLALGGSEVNLLELTSAYGTIAAEGKYHEPHGITRIIDRRGDTIYQGKSQPKQALDKETSAIVTWMLEPVVQQGTGAAAQLDNRPVAGKTGTSDEARDLWFIGYIPQLVTGVWLGNDDSYPTWGSSSTAAFTWRQFMEKAVEGMPVEEFPEIPERLDGRKEFIKTKPVTPNSIFYGDTTPDNAQTGSANAGDYSEGYY
nr:penicillin-binding protein 1A [Laspinema sp. D3b]